MSAGPATPGPSRLSRAARALLLLYPQAWRQRYRSEVTELLAHHHISPRTLLDLLLGAIDARLHPDLFSSGELTVTRKIRAGQFVVSCAAALYATAIICLQQIRDPQAAWLQAAARHPQLRSGLIAAQATGGLAVLAGIAGLLLVTTVMVRQAAAARSGKLRRAAVRAAVLAIAWLGVTATALAVTSSRPGTGLRPLRAIDLALEFAWLASTVIAVLLGAALLWQALASAELPGAIVRPTRVMAAVATAAMTAGLIATITEAILLQKYAPALIGTGWLTAIGAGMLAATAMTGLALLQMRNHLAAPTRLT